MPPFVYTPRESTLATSPIREIVDDRFDITQAFAAESYEAAKGFMEDVVEFVKDLEPPPTEEIEDVPIPSVPDIDFGARPTLGDLVLPNNWPTNVPTSPSLETLPVLNDIDIPAMSFQPPEWTAPNKPTLVDVSPPGSAPMFVAPNMPVAPTITLPNAPTLATITLPSAPEISIPAVDFGLEATVDLGELPAGFSWEESPYNSDVWNTLLDNVIVGLTSGGTGLGADVEQEIWDRARRRQQAVNDKIIRDIESGFASRGWPAPPGALAGQLLEAQEEIARNDTDLNGKIAIEQAELALKNGQFYVERGIDIERVLRDFHTAQAGRSLEGAKVASAAAIDLYKARFDRFNLDIERCKARAIVYEARVRAAIENVNVFKAQIEAAKVSADIQQTLVAIYERQVAAAETMIKLYNAQMTGAQLAVQVETAKLEAFKSETQAYVARIEAERIKFDIYGKEVDAETAKAQAYAERVRGFIAEVEAAKTRSEMQLSKLTAAATRNNLLIEQYKGEIQGYTATVDAEAKKVDGVVRGFEAEARAYTAETGAAEAMYSTQIKVIEARIQQSRALVEKAVAQIESATRGYVAIKEIQAKSIEGPMNVSAQMTASALSAVHASASIGGSISRSEGYDYNHSASISETHGYQHE